jgi:penicillin-binding protein 2
LATSITIRDNLLETRLVRSRLVVALTVVGLLLLALVVRLHFLQVARYEHYATLSQSNRIDLIPLPPVRGLIYDRNGVLLADNIPVHTLETVPDQIDDIDVMIERVSTLVDLTDTDIRRYREQLRRRPWFERITLKSGLSHGDASRFAVNQYAFKGVELSARLQRQYPLKGLTGHVVGYVGRISEHDLGRIDPSRYKGTDYIGKLGVEAYYEDRLLGDAGFQQVETNAHGRVVRSLSRSAPVAGVSLHLSLDVRLQEVAWEALGAHRGAIVAIEPETGGVLAFVSKPAYDPNPFVNGIDQEAYRLLRSSPDRPLLNRALHGRYAPGSTIKGFMALAGLEEGVDPKQTIFCPGYFSLPNSSHRYRDWKKEGHGRMDMHEAVEQSCDVYFYRLARQLGIEAMHEHLSRFGFGRATGIDLGEEPAGLMPSPEWKRSVRNEPWYPGETVIAGIGQGFILVTPLQLASITATLANRGRFVQPRLMRSFEDPATRVATGIRSVEQSFVEIERAEHYERVIRAMTDVVHGDRGTARRLGVGTSYRMAGKTGTAQVIGIAQNEKYDESKVDERFRDHSLFIAFAPVDSPRIAVAVVVENGGSGSRTAAPMAKQVIDYYLIERLRSAGAYRIFATGNGVG